MADNVTGLTVGLDTEQAIKNAKKLEDALIAIEDVVKKVNDSDLSTMKDFDFGKMMKGSLAEAETTLKGFNTSLKNGVITATEYDKVIAQWRDKYKEVLKLNDSLNSKVIQAPTLQKGDINKIKGGARLEDLNINQTLQAIKVVENQLAMMGDNANKSYQQRLVNSKAYYTEELRMMRLSSDQKATLLAREVESQRKADEAKVRDSERAAKEAAKQAEIASRQAYQQRISTVSGAMGLQDNTIAQRTEKIRALQAVQQNLNKTDADYANNLRRVNNEIRNLDKANKEATTSGIKLDNAKRRLINTADQLTRRFALIFSVSQITGYFNKLVEVRGEFELQNKALAAILQNKNAADKLFGQITALAVKSPFQLKELITYTKQLSAYRIETERLFDTTKMLADVSAGLGVSMDRLTLAYGQVKAANYLRGQELRQFSEAGINILGELADKFSEVQGRAISTGEVFEMVSNRMVTFKDVDEVFQKMTQSGGIFYNMQELQAETLKGKVSNLTDAIDIMLNKIGTEQESTLKGAVDAVRYLVENYEILSGLIQGLIAAYGLYRLNLMLTNKALIESALTQGIINSSQIKSISVLQLLSIGWKSFTAGVGAASVAMKTFIASNAWLLAISLAVTGIYKLISASNEHDKQLKEIAKRYDDIFKQVKDITVDFKINTDKNDFIKQKSNLSSLVEYAKKELNLEIKIDWSNINADNIVIEFNKIQTTIKDTNFFIEDFLKGLQKTSEWKIEDDIFEDFEQLGESTSEFSKYLQKNINDVSYSLQQLGDAISETQKESLKILETPRQDNPKLDGYETELDYMNRLKKGYDLLTAEYNAYQNARIQAKTPESASKLNVALAEQAKILKSLGIDTSELSKLSQNWSKDITEAEKEFKQFIKTINVPKGISDEQKTVLLKAAIDSAGAQKSWNEFTKQYVAKWTEETFYIKFIPVIPEEKQFSNFQKKLQEYADKYAPNIGYKVEIDKEQSDIIDELNQRYNNTDATIKRLTQSNKILSLGEQAKLDILKNELVQYDLLRKAAGFTEKESKSTKDEQAEKIKAQIALIKEAQKQYEKLRQEYDKPTAKAKTEELFLPKFAAQGIEFEVDFENLDPAFEKLGSNLGKKITKGSKEAIEKERFDIKLEAQLNTKYLEDVKSQMASAFENFELTLELESAGVPTDLIKGMFPADYTSQVDLFKKVQDAIDKLRVDGGEKSIEQAEALEKKLADIKQKDLVDRLKNYQSLIEENRTIQEQITQIEKDGEEERANIAKDLAGKDQSYIDKAIEGSKAKQAKLIADLTDQIIQQTGLYKNLFGDISDVGSNTLNKWIKDFQKAIDTAKKSEDGKGAILTIDGVDYNVTMEQLTALGLRVGKIAEQAKKNNPFLALKEAIKAYNKTADETAKKDAMNKIFQAGFGAAQQLGEVIGELSGLFETLGIDMSGAFGAALGGIQKTLEGLGSIDITKPFSIITGSIKAIGGIFETIFNPKDARLAKVIEKEKKAVESLERAYDKLQKAKNAATNLKAQEASYEEQKKNLKAQEEAIKRAQEANSKRKKKNREDNQEYLNQLEDIREKEAELDKERLSSQGVFELKEAIKELVDAWEEAYYAGENTFDALDAKVKEFVRNLIKQMVIMSGVDALIKPMREAIVKALEGDGKIDKSELDIINKLGDAATTNINEYLKSMYEGLGILAGVGKDAELSALQKGIQGITEETAGALEALLNTIVYEMFRSGAVVEERLLYICDTLAMSNSLASRSLTELSGIHTVVKEMRAWQKGITGAGHPNGGDGLKVFIN